MGFSLEDITLFISFEGIEGCGKSTQVQRLAQRLKQLSIPVVVTLEPGGTSVGKHIRRILLDSRNSDLSPLAELFLYEADRAQHMLEVIGPALKNKKWVLCDRYYDATLAYQGYARGQDLELIKSLNNNASGGIGPDITFLVDCPVEVGLKRAIERDEHLRLKNQDRFEKEKLDFHDAVRKGYLLMAAEEDSRFYVVDGALSEKELEREIFKILRPHIPAGKRT
jgi:dTMP kinase